MADPRGRGHATGFQSTLSVRRATEHASDGIHRFLISIHALREESDKMLREAWPNIHISIHALREESDHRTTFMVVGHDAFQSTLSVRRATPPMPPPPIRANFNPRSP